MLKGGVGLEFPSYEPYHPNDDLQVEFTPGTQPKSAAQQENSSGPEGATATAGPEGATAPQSERNQKGGTNVTSNVDKQPKSTDAEGARSDHPATVETITDNDFEVQDELESVENAGQHSGEPVQTGLGPGEAEYADEIDLAAQYPGRFNATGFEHLQESMADEPLSASNLIASAACTSSLG